MESTLLHPPLVHFAIVLPMVALVFQIAYSISSNYVYSQWSARILIISAVMMGLAWYTGGLEGKDVYPFLSTEGQSVLLQHKNIGFYLMIATGILAVAKFFACKVRNVPLESLVLVGLFAISSSLAYQGLLGGDIVYKYGGSVEKYSDGMECLNDPSMFVEEEEEHDEQEDEG